MNSNKYMTVNDLVTSHVKKQMIIAIVLLLEFIALSLIIFNGKMNSFLLIVMALIFIAMPLKESLKLFQLIMLKKNNKFKQIHHKNVNVIFDGKDYTLTDDYIIDYKNKNVIMYDEINKIQKNKNIKNIFSKHPRLIEKVYIYTDLKKYSLISKALNEQSILNKLYYNDLYDFIKSKNNKI